MIKNILFTAVMLAAFVCAAGAESWRRGGYNGPSSLAISKISEVKNMPHDANVILEGKIENRFGNEKYLFNDGSDTINLEIDNDEWKGLEVGPNDTVIIYGEVDKRFHQMEIEVERIEIKNS